MNSARSLVRGLQRARDECGWDLAEACLPQCEGFLRRIEDALPRTPPLRTRTASGHGARDMGQGGMPNGGSGMNGHAMEISHSHHSNHQHQQSQQSQHHDERHRHANSNGHHGTNGYDHDRRSYMSEDTPNSMGKGSSGGTGTNWQMSIEELFPEIFSDFTDSALFDGPSYG